MISLLIGFFMLSFFISKGGNSLASLAAAWAMALIWLSARIGVGVGEVDDLTDCLSVCKNTQNFTRLGHPHLLLSILLSTLYQEANQVSPLKINRWFGWHVISIAIIEMKFTLHAYWLNHQGKWTYSGLTKKQIFIKCQTCWFLFKHNLL